MKIEYLNNMKKILGDEYDEYLKSFDTEKYNAIRTNTLKISKTDLKKLLDFETESVEWCEEGLYFNSEERPSKNPLYYAGLFYIQEPSAMSVASIINIDKSDRVLDLCAAPGGKSTQVACRLDNTGIVVSNDISATRSKAIVKNIELMGIRNVIITSETPQRLSEKLPNYFNKIIVDAPCSGEGMFRSNKDVLKTWDKISNEKFSAIQKEILDASVKLLKNGGEIVYSTCTFSPVENEFVVKDFLENHKNFEIVPLNHKKLGISKGLVGLEEAGRIWPHRAKGEGHFIALLREKGKAIKNPKSENIIYDKVKGIDDFYNFVSDNFYNFPKGNLKQIDNKLFLLHDDAPDLSGLRVLRNCFYLGELKTKRFEPSQALAMHIKKNDYKKTVDFNLNDRNIIRYLEGESFEVDAQEGFNLICVEGFPLGFGKVVNGRMKNKYSRSWKM